MSRIAESELIINPRGAVYHLDLRPEEIAGTVITVGDPGRVKEISKHFDSVEVKRNHREFITHTGYVGKKRLTVLSSGIGPDNIDIVMNELDALVNIDFGTREIKKHLGSVNIIRIGTSGSLQADIPVDSFVASTHGLGIDNLLNFYRHEQNEEEKQLLHSFVTHTQIQSKSSQYRAMDCRKNEVGGVYVDFGWRLERAVESVLGPSRWHAWRGCQPVHQLSIDCVGRWLNFLASLSA